MLLIIVECWLGLGDFSYDCTMISLRKYGWRAYVPLLTGLRRVRELRAWSQRDLAERSGVAQATIVGLEGGREARHITTRKLAAALGVKPAELIGEAQDIKVAA